MNVPKKLGKMAIKILSKGRHSAKLILKIIVSSLTRSLPKGIHKNIVNGDFYYWLFKPERTQRVFLKEDVGVLDFFETLNKRKVDYVLLRWWEELPSFPANEDINIMVKDEHRELINDLVDRIDNRGVKCDVYTASGDKNGDRFNIPVFSQNLSRTLLEERILFNGVYIPSPLPYFASVAYHAIFHKGKDSGIPGFDKKPAKYVFDYTSTLEILAGDLNLNLQINVTSLYNWLKEQGYAPADDTLGKLSKRKPELDIFAQRLYSDIRGGELMVFVVREQLLLDGFLDDFVNFLNTDFQFDILDVKILNEQEKRICSSDIRGGKWDKGPWKASGGIPAALVVAFDYHPKPIDYVKRSDLNRTTNENSVNAKYAYRKRLNGFVGKKGRYNGVHSGDNEFDARHYISLIGDTYCKEILSEVEKRRIRYSRMWKVEKLLSANSVSKSELINYEGRLAVKKTFRPGKEPVFKKQLNMVKDLSKELDSIPPLLEEGEGFMVVPFYENLLESISEKEKKIKIASHSSFLKELNQKFLAKGYSWNFSLDELIVTPENRIYFTGYSSLKPLEDLAVLSGAEELIQSEFKF